MKLRLLISMLLTLYCAGNLPQKDTKPGPVFIVEAFEDYTTFYEWGKTPWYRVSDDESMFPITVALARWGNSYLACIVDPLKEWPKANQPFKCSTQWRFPR